MAPEMMLEEKDKYGTPLDIYCYGMVLYELLFGANPFREQSGSLHFLLPSFFPPFT